jgi:hypothetical protein
LIGYTLLLALPDVAVFEHDGVQIHVGLRMIEFGVPAVLPQERFVRAVFQDLPVLEDEDAIGLLHCVEAMGDQ